MPRLGPGHRVGPYEVVSFLAAGGMGEVYRGHDARLGRPVAIKVLPESSFGDEAAVLRFQREARAAAAVSHPNLVSIYDVGREGDVHYLVMDLLEGATLRERLRAGVMSWPKAAELGIAIAEGIGAVHAKGFVHRDLKPENIFLTSDGWVKLLDFGLAVPKLTVATPREHDATLPRGLTGSGMIVGTIGYMPPEQLRGEEIDARADIFAAGCVLYEMLAGEPLFQGATQADVIAEILHGREELVVPKHVPGKLARIVRHCVERDREKRFQSAADLAFALRLVSNAASATPPALREASIAVLPFENLSGERDSEYFSDGLSEEILNSLARVPGLSVTARSSAFAFRGKREDVRRVGQALGVRTILEGGVRHAGARVRVTAQLVDTSSGYQLWSERYDRALTDVFAVQDEIAAAIVDTLHIRLVPQAAASPRHTPNIEAYQAYLKSRYHFGKLSPERLMLSQACAQQAIALDPDYAAPHAQLAECFIQAAVYGIEPGTEMMPKARAAAQRAVALDEQESSAHMTLARIAAELDYDWTEALRRCRMALACEGISAPVRALCAQFVLWPLGRLDELDAAIAPALIADPLSPMPRVVSVQALSSRGEHDEALRALDEIIEMHEHFWPGHLARAMLHGMNGRRERAIEALERGLAVSPWNPLFVGMLAAHRGEELPAITAERVPSEVLRALGRSSFHFIRGDYDRTAAEYETVLATRYPVAAHYLTWLFLTPEFRESAAGRGLRRITRLPGA